MTYTEKKIAEIREALEKATPGPWVAVDEIATVYSTNADAVIEYSADEREEDIRLIANAPEWIRFLLNELELVNRERDKLIDGLRTVMKFAAEDGIHWKLDRCYTTARDILNEIGVTVE